VAHDHRDLPGTVGLQMVVAKMCSGPGSDPTERVVQMDGRDRWGVA